MQFQAHTQDKASRPFDTQVALFNCLELRGPTIPFARNEELFGEGEPNEFIYKIISGAVRSYKLLTDGRRQITGFYLPGDIVGLHEGTEHSTSAEAIANSLVLVVRRSTVIKSAENDIQLARNLWKATVVELARAQSHALLLIKSAQERVAAFILDMADRLQVNGTIELPMSRQDIADFLGLTIETVSRTLTLFTDDSAIELVASRRILLRNRSALSELNS